MMTNRMIAGLLITMSISVQVFSQYDKYLVKADASYRTGDYIKASKYNEKLKKKVIKKIGQTNNYMAMYYLNKAKYDLARGLMINFKANLDQALSISEQANTNNKVDHAITMLEATEVLIRYGNYVDALNNLTKAEALFQEINEFENYKAKIELSKAKILTGQGFYNQSLSFIETNLDYWTGRAVSKESVVDSKTGKLKTVNLTDEEVLDRYGDYATALTLKANTLRKQGEIVEADNAFGFADGWIDKNMRKESIQYIDNLYSWALMLEESGTRELPEKYFERSLNYLKRVHTESHYKALDIYESLLKNYLLEEKSANYKNLKTEYERVIKKYFTKNSMHYINLESLEFDKKFEKNRTGNIENRAAAIVSNNLALPVNHAKRVELLKFLHSVAIANKVYQNAENYQKEIIEIKKNIYGENTPEYHLSRIKLANFYLDYTNKLNEAGDIYKVSFHDVVEKEISSGHVEYVEILNHLAEYYEVTDNYKLASKTLDNALLATRAKYDDRDVNYGIELEKIANLQLKIGEYDKAEENLKISLDILRDERRDENDVIHYVKSLETQAKLDAIKGLYDDAESNINRSKKFLKRASSTVQYDELAANEELASLYIDLGRYRSTEELLGISIAQKEAIFGTDSRNLLDPLTNYGKVMLIKGDYTEAEKTARRALDIARNTFGENSTKLAKPLKLLSQTYYTIGDYDKAEDNILRAIKIEEKQFGRNHIEVAISLTNLGLIKFYKGDNRKDIELIFDEAKLILEDKLGNRNPRYAENLKNLAVVYIATNRYDEAFNALTLAETIWSTKVGRRNNINTASIYILIGDIYYRQSQYKNAETEYNKAKVLFEKFFNDNHPEYVKVLSKLSKVHYMEGDSRKAKNSIEEAIANYNVFIKDYFPALSEREKAKFWNTIKGDYEYYNTLAITLKDEFPKMIEEMYNNALTTKALLLSSSIKVRERILNSGDTALINTFNNWVDKKEILTAALSMGPEQLAAEELDPTALGNEVEQIEKQLSEQSEIFGSTFEEKGITWENVKNSLGPNEVAIEMVRFRYFNHTFSDSVIYAGLYVTNDKSLKRPEIFTMNNGQDMEDRYFKFYRNSIIFKIKDRFSYDIYWNPISERVGVNSTLYLSADGVYNQINLEAIPTQDGKYVIDNSNIILVSNTKDIYLNKITTDASREDHIATMFGNPIYYASAAGSQKIGQLPGTEKEIAELTKLLNEKGWDITDYTGNEASESQVKELNNPKVFHIATHGFFTQSSTLDENALTQNEAEAARNPLLRTGLLMKGAGDLLDKTAFNYNMEEGILTAYEAMNLNLDQTDLVVLSACETGLGDLQVGEGVYGLQRAFMVAGARTLIMSMFKVSDEATQKLMIKFYQKWLETGDKRKSFVEAKKEVRNEFPDPIFWGAFIMIGLD